MDNTVYLGTWTNWSRGPVIGQTLTTTKEYGSLLIAFTAVFIGFVGSRFWRILCLVLHWGYSTPESRDTIHHQRQVVLRNSLNPESGFLDALRLLWAWRRIRVRRLLRLIPLVLLAFASLAAFTVAGGFSSSISNSVGDEVLIRSPLCGPINGDISTIGEVAIRARINADTLTGAENYAQQCYGTNTHPSTTTCNKFVKSRLPTETVEFNASCPFQESICRSPQSSIRLDTGYLDSNDVLGLNTPSDRRFAWRYVLQCAPLKTEGYTSEEDGFVQFNYGKSFGGYRENQTVLDFVYRVENGDSQYDKLKPGDSTVGLNYRLSAQYTRMFKGKRLDGFFDSVPELVRTDGDTTLAFLSGNGVVFYEAMDDGWYQAMQAFGNVSSPTFSGNHLAYRPSVAAWPMGCLEQWQWCNPALPRDTGCGPLASRFDALYGAVSLFNLRGEDLDPERPSSSDALGSQLIWPALITTGYPTKLLELIEHLGAKSLESQSRLFNGIQYSLPENQWQLVVDTAQGQNDSDFQKAQSPPLNVEETNLCNNQKIRSSAHTSFNLFGLIFTYSMGAFTILASFTIEPLLKLLYKRRVYKPYSYLEWISNTSLQLHRLAHEEFGLITWSHSTDTVPITDHDVFLASLDISDPKHPTLHRSTNIGVTTEPEQKPEPEAVEHAINTEQAQSTPDTAPSASRRTSNIRLDSIEEIDHVDTFSSDSGVDNGSLEGGTENNGVASLETEPSRDITSAPEVLPHN